MQTKGSRRLRKARRVYTEKSPLRVMNVRSILKKKAPKPGPEMRFSA